MSMKKTAQYLRQWLLGTNSNYAIFSDHNRIQSTVAVCKQLVVQTFNAVKEVAGSHAS